MTEHRRKLIEVALPLEAINRESAREKSIRHGHPSTLHLWWARRPLAAARAVIFSQLVDDPSSRPDKYPTQEDQDEARKKLFELIEELVKWENIGNEALFARAHAEILDSTDGNPPPILDPFAGGGSIPLEAQRLGLEAHASDLNPVAVLINKALIEIPPKYAGQPPVFPGAADERNSWPRATGLAEDVRRYGQWMRDEAEKRIGHLYPKATLPDGTKANVIAWIWARTVTCPNPACGAEMPLVSTWWLAKNRARPTWIQPVVDGGEIDLLIKIGPEGPPAAPKIGQGANFVCTVCRFPASRDYISSQFEDHKVGSRLLATVAEGYRQRVYLPATTEHAEAALVSDRPNGPDQVARGTFGGNAQGRRYGFLTFSDYFTDRQPTALIAFSDLVQEARRRALSDALAVGLSDAEDYARSVSVYLSFALSKVADRGSSLCSWVLQRESIRNTFSRQAISMTWDFAEMNMMLEGAGSYSGAVEWTVESLEGLADLSRSPASTVVQANADEVVVSGDLVVCTDPPYYDNIGYSDLSDFFYVWLRRSLGPDFPGLMNTVLTPKADELVAATHRFRGSRKLADAHFERGFVRVFSIMRQFHSADVPLCLFYAFRQVESSDEGAASTGWETMLNGLVEAGLAITATWPVRTERPDRSVGLGTNALASSIVLACRPRPDSAVATNRRGFIATLKSELPEALRRLQQGSVAPVDRAQAAIGPGMAVFTRHSQVLEADGSSMTVRTALALINQVLDETLSEQEGDFDADTRFCVAWFTEYQWGKGKFGRADDLARAKNTSVAGLERGGIFRATKGDAWLVPPEDLIPDWDPSGDERTSIWEAALHIVHALNTKGTDAASALMNAAGQRVDLGTVKELAYLLYSVCERRGWSQSAILFNTLGTTWSDLESAALQRPKAQPEVQSAFGFDEDNA